MAVFPDLHESPVCFRLKALAFAPFIVPARRDGGYVESEPPVEQCLS